ncbi:MAG: glycoside hydrolase family 43 protein [Eubacteriales bacterium]
MKISNPILKGFNPDPSICKDGDDYYITTSTFEWFPGVQIHHSKDLANWTLVKRPLERLSQINMLGNRDSGGVWAPCLTKEDGKFWLIYSDVKQFGGGYQDVHNYLVTADRITGEWSDPIFLNSSGFDPSLFHDEDGRKYVVNMIWDHRSGNNFFYGIQMQEYSVEKEKLVGAKNIIFKGTNLAFTEGPHIYKKGDYYYLMTAEGGTGYEHAVTVARAKELWGPYEVHPENPILTSWNNPELMLQKAGHASMIPITDELWALVHLCSRPLETRGDCPLGRETALQAVVWKEDWPYLKGGVLPKDIVSDFDLPEVMIDSKIVGHDDFEEKTMNIHFQSLRVPIAENASLSERESHLRLYGRESLCSEFIQAHLARRWQSFYFTAQTKVEFHPESFQQSAGLTMYYNTANWFFLSITGDEEMGRIIQLSHLTGGKDYKDYLSQDKIAVPADVDYVYLKADVKSDKMMFSYSFDGSNYSEIQQEFYTGQLSDDYMNKINAPNGFIGAFVGMACIDASGERIPADFDFFEYIEL